MINLDIGLRGLQVAQRALELIGTNIANAGTDGYHRQDLGISPLDFASQGAVASGQANITQVTRNVDFLLEQEIFRQQPLSGQVYQELMTLQTVEGAIGTVDSSALSAAISKFFNSMRELTAYPTNFALREQALWAAQDMAAQFQNLANFIADQKAYIRLQAQNLVAEVNNLGSEIASLNNEIQIIGSRGGNTNLLRDRRDQAIMELGQLVDIKVNQHTEIDGVVNVSCWGTPLVVGANSIALEAGLSFQGLLGISIKDANYFLPELRGGQMGGLLAAYNELLPEIAQKLDTLAVQIISNINAHHVQGVGESGSFAELTGTSLGGSKLSAISSDIKSGQIFVRVINQATGEVTRQAIAVNAATDTLASIAAKLNALNGISSSVVNSALRIKADTGYRFDFLPALTSGPMSSTLTGSSSPTISGIYTGAANQIYTFQVCGSGEVGVTEGLALEVRDPTGTVVKRLNIGSGYAAGDVLEVVEGVCVALSAGTVIDEQDFKVQALAKSDTSGLLAVAGMNTFFAGHSAASIAVREELAESPNLLAFAVGPEMTDNVNVRRMAEVGWQELAALGGTTPQEYLRRIMAGVGQAVAVRQARQTAMEKVGQQLMAHRDTVSGVDINEEAAKMLLFERMFQAMSKFIATQDRSLRELMELL